MALAPPGRRVAAATFLSAITFFVVLAAASSASSRSPEVSLEPAVIQLHETARVRVRAVGDATAVDVRLRGASMPSGTLLPWTHLTAAHGVWVGRLGQPALRGVYPVELRVGPGRTHLVRDAWLLRVLPPAALQRPAFTTPEEVVQWWVADVAHGSLAAVRDWPLPANDHRDPRLHRLFVVAYDAANATDSSDQRGIWITAFRDGYHGQWRLLQATIQP
jgi:hypothetical protein